MISLTPMQIMAFNKKIKKNYKSWICIILRSYWKIASINRKFQSAVCICIWLHTDVRTKLLLYAKPDCLCGKGCNSRWWVPRVETLASTTGPKHLFFNCIEFYFKMIILIPFFRIPFLIHILFYGLYSPKRPLLS